jgi:chemotaxis signal transduction protein/hemoglobin-like flavoprotein
VSTQEGTTRQLVVTKVGEIQCGIEIDAVHEIIPMQKITAVPKSPCNMLGVTNVRGAVIPVADLKACLGFPRSPLTNETRIVLVSYRESKVGLVVDAVAEVLTLANEVFQSATGNLSQSAFLRAIARLDDRLILVIDHACVIENGLDTAPSDASPGTDAIREAGEVAVRDAAGPGEQQDTGGLNVDLLESSFALLAPRGEELVERFYARLFETAPAVRSLFPEDMAGQKKALLGAIGALVGNLRAPEKLSAYLEGLGKRHIAYGALEAHYDVVGDVLLATLAELAGDVWTDDLNAAWSGAFAAVKALMLAGAEGVELAA